MWWTRYLHIWCKRRLFFSFYHLAQRNYRLEHIFSSDLEKSAIIKAKFDFKTWQVVGWFFLWNSPSNIICIVLKGSSGLDHVLLLLNPYYFLSFILEGGCFCSRWLLRFIVNCLHPFFCTKPQVPPTSGTQRSFTCYSEALCSPATPQHALWWEMTLSESSPTAPSSLLPKGSGNSWFHSGSLWDNTDPPQRRKSAASAHPSPILGKQQWKPLHSALQQSTFAVTGMENALTQPFQELQLCLYKETLQCRDLSPWQRAPNQSSSASSFSAPLHHTFISARLAKSEPSHNTQSKFASRPLLHDFAGDFTNKGRFYLLY